MVLANGWIFSRTTDFLVFMGPVFLGWSAYAFFNSIGAFNPSTSPLVIYLAAVPFMHIVDNAHVYSTFFRTYLDPRQFQIQKRLLILLPIVCYAIGFALNRVSSSAFWLTIVYLNIFHVVRQQYGWMALSTRKAGKTQSAWEWKLDQIAIYVVSIYPFLWWHAHPKGFKFNGEFIPGLPVIVADISTGLYWAFLLFYVGIKFYRFIQDRSFNLTKFYIFVGTSITFYSSVILSKNEAAFYILGGAIHQIPYIYLIYFYGQRRWENKSQFPNVLFHNHGWIVYLIILTTVAIGHETLDSGLESTSMTWLWYYITPLLTLPQILHYVLDGYIWKVGKDQTLRLKLGMR